MSTYLDSNKVSVYPAVHRVDYVSDARLWSEKNLVRLINQLTDMKSFVISTEYIQGQSFEYNQLGYYFKLSNFDTQVVTDGSGNYIYSEIIIENNQLTCSDIDNQFTGLHLFKSESIIPEINPENESSKRFLILERVGNVWSIPQSSQIKFSSRSVGLPSFDVDGGKI